MHQKPALLILCALAIAGCGRGEEDSGTESSSTTVTTTPDACDAAGLTSRDWQGDGATAPALRTVVADFTVSTRAGDWTLSEGWTGCHSYLFIPSIPRQSEGWPTPLWQRDTKAFLDKLPTNTHVFFVSSADNKAEMNADLDLIEGKMNKAIDKQPEAAQAAWRDQLHYVDKQVSNMTDTWVGQYLTSPGYGFGIDRFQQLRDIGSFADGERYNNDMGWFEPNLSQAAYEAVAYNFASDRQDELDAQQDLFVVPTFTGQVVSDEGWSGVRGFVQIDLPTDGEMSGYNALDIDMNMTCGGAGEFGTCPAWDRITTLYVCDQDTDATNAYDDQVCQPRVPETTGVDEVPADTVPCGCADVMSEPYTAQRTCDADGLGYGECSCSCSTELSRWITTYHREGRWLTDADFALPWFQRGGKITLSYYSIDPWAIAIDLRFHNEDRADKPTLSYDLFDGGTFNATYNDKYVPLDLYIPADATKVELAVIITGHGQESPGNCAEFCNTQHHFGVNGTENLIEFPWLDDATLTPDYCQAQVDEGTIPNQYGTWFYARSNWCPGKEVAPIYVDITDQITKGATNTFTYFGDRDGAPYSENASIDLGSFLVIHQ